MNELLQRARIIIADGAMGTQLQAAGLEPGASGELWNVVQPERVRGVHAAYVLAGAEVLLTNTFGASRIALERHDLAEQVIAINTAAAQNALQAAGENAWVLGDIGPFGGFLEPLGDTPRDVAFEAFREQAATLLSAYVDGIIIETMSALEELELAVQAARAAGGKLIATSVSFESTRVGLRTMTGATPEMAAEKMTELHVDILAANCGTDLTPDDYAAIVKAYRTVNEFAPVLVKMNAGSPRLEGDRTAYDTAPADFAAALPRLVDAGADIIGGCCGTTPAHIWALSQGLA